MLCTKTSGSDMQGSHSGKEASMEGKSINSLQEVPELPLIVERVSCEVIILGLAITS